MLTLISSAPDPEEVSSTGALSRNPSIPEQKLSQPSPVRAGGFTLIELAVVITIIGVVTTLMAIRLGTFTFWKEEAFIRRLSETLIFLHHQAMVDQSFYRVDFDFEKREYKVGVLKPEGEDDSSLATLASADAGSLTLELAAFLSPSLGVSQTLIPPPSFPSMAEPVPLPEDMLFMDLRTMRGQQNQNENGIGAYILFSPRGFSEFAVIHLRLSGGSQVTILVNPFTGLTEVYREYRDFEWTYGKNNI